jgi:hypothetical protein
VGCFNWFGEICILKAAAVLSNYFIFPTDQSFRRESVKDDDITITIIVSWNQAVHTDREVTAIRPDIQIIINNKKEKTCTLIDAAEMSCKRKRKRS